MARIRSARAHSRVLDAALALFSERGIESTSMDAIAEASGVSKATIYKHWADKDALCLEAMARLHRVDERPVLGNGSVRQDLLTVLGYRPPNQDTRLNKRLMPHFMAYAAHHNEFGEAWRSRVLDPPRNELASILKRGIAEGLFPADLSLEYSLALLLGPVLYYRVFNKDKGEIPAGLVEAIVDTFSKAHAWEGKREAPRRLIGSPLRRKRAGEQRC